MLQFRRCCIVDMPPMPNPLLPFVPSIAKSQHHVGTFLRFCGQAQAPLSVSLVHGVGRVWRRAVGDAGTQLDRLADTAGIRINVGPTSLPIPMATPYLRAMAMRHHGLADLLSGDLRGAANGPIVTTPCLLQIAPLEKAGVVSEQAIEHSILHGGIRHALVDILVEHILGGLVIPNIATLAILATMSYTTVRTARANAMLASAFRFHTAVVPQGEVAMACDAVLLPGRVADGARRGGSCFPILACALVRLALNSNMPWAIVNHLDVVAFVAICTNMAQML